MTTHPYWKKFNEDGIRSEKEALMGTMRKVAGIMTNRHGKRYFVSDDGMERVTLLKVTGIPLRLPERWALFLFPPQNHEGLRYVKIFSGQFGFSEKSGHPKITGIIWDSPREFRAFDEIFRKELCTCGERCRRVVKFQEHCVEQP